MEMEMEMEISIHNSLPYDVIFNIVSSLPVRDVCVLGVCSKFWRDFCESDTIWVFLSIQRWPSLNLSQHQSSFSGWKTFYENKHHEMAERASKVIKCVEQCSSSVSLEACDYLKAIQDLWSMQLDFKDVEVFLFKPKLNVLLNLVGLHYCISWLGVPSNNVLKALLCSEISERQVSIKWWKLGGRFYGFRQRDESQCRVMSLADLMTHQHHDVLGVLHRGAVYEVLRVQISVAYPLSDPWTRLGSVSHR